VIGTKLRRDVINSDLSARLSRSGVLPDFFIGGHAAVIGLRLLNRDALRYRRYFPNIELVTPWSCRPPRHRHDKAAESPFSSGAILRKLHARVIYTWPETTGPGPHASARLPPARKGPQTAEETVS